MNIKTYKYIYRICIAVLPVITAVLGLADAHVPDKETGDDNPR